MKPSYCLLTKGPSASPYRLSIISKKSLSSPEYCDSIRSNFLDCEMTKMIGQDINRMVPSDVITNVFGFLGIRSGVAQVCRHWRRLFASPHLLKPFYQDESLSAEQQTALFEKRLSMLQPGPGYLEGLAELLYFTRKTSFSYTSSQDLSPKSDFNNTINILNEHLEMDHAIDENEAGEIKRMSQDRLEKHAEIQRKQGWHKKASLEISAIENKFPLVFLLGEHYIKLVASQFNVLAHFYGRLLEPLEGILSENRLPREDARLGDEFESIMELNLEGAGCVIGEEKVFFLHKLFQLLEGKKLGKAAFDNVKLIKHLGYVEILKKMQKNDTANVKEITLELDSMRSAEPTEDRAALIKAVTDGLPVMESKIQFFNEKFSRFSENDIRDILSLVIYAQRSTFSHLSDEMVAHFNREFENKLGEEWQNKMSRIVSELEDLGQPSWNEKREENTRALLQLMEIDNDSLEPAAAEHTAKRHRL